jgi:hypothetical protein
MHTLILIFSKGHPTGGFSVHSQQVPGFTSKEEADAAGEEALKGMKGDYMGVSFVSVEVK